jgi:tRNA(fMet)-specific endonuclease VapC
MLAFIFDTNHLSIFEQCHPLLMKRFFAWPIGAVGTNIVSAEESLRGRFAAIARATKPADRMRTYSLFFSSIQTLQSMPIAQFNSQAEYEYQRVCSLKPNLGGGDQKIAAIALAPRATLLTRNSKHFVGISGLHIDDWTT